MGNRHLTDEPVIPSAELLRRVVELCLDRKAEDVVSLDVRGLVEYMDHMVIATGRSPRQNRAIAEHVLTQLKREHRILPLSKAGMGGGSWICVDLVDIVLHVFEPDAREHYDLELLWGDAIRTEYESPVGGPADGPADASGTSDAGELPGADEPAASSLEAQMIQDSQQDAQGNDS